MDRKLLPYENVFLLSLPFLKWNSQIISDLLLKHSPYKACNYLETILQAENFILCYPCSLLHQCVAFFFYLKSKFFQSTNLFYLVSAHFLTLKRSGCRNLYGTSIEMGMSGWSCILSWQLSLTACVMQSYSVFVTVSKKNEHRRNVSFLKGRTRAQNDPKKQVRSFEINVKKLSKENCKGLQLKKWNAQAWNM